MLDLLFIQTRHFCAFLFHRPCLRVRWILKQLNQFTASRTCNFFTFPWVSLKIVYNLFFFGVLAWLIDFFANFSCEKIEKKEKIETDILIELLYNRLWFSLNFWSWLSVSCKYYTWGNFILFWIIHVDRRKPEQSLKSWWVKKKPIVGYWMKQIWNDRYFILTK